MSPASSWLLVATLALCFTLTVVLFHMLDLRRRTEHAEHRADFFASSSQEATKHHLAELSTVEGIALDALEQLVNQIYLATALQPQGRLTWHQSYELALHFVARDKDEYIPMYSTQLSHLAHLLDLRLQPLRSTEVDQALQEQPNL